MIRPLSIVRFEQCYLGALVVGLVNSALTWSATANSPQVQRVSATFGSGFLPVTILIGLGISLLLWYFVARRGSVVAKWFVVVFFAFSVLGVLSGLAMHSMAPGFGGVLAIVGFVLNAIAVVMLFKPDARPWFGDDDGEPIA